MLLSTVLVLSARFGIVLSVLRYFFPDSVCIDTNFNNLSERPLVLEGVSRELENIYHEIFL